MVMRVLEQTEDETTSAKNLLSTISEGVKAGSNNEAPELNPFGEGHKGGQFYFIKVK
jgi:hypothetical protein